LTSHAVAEAPPKLPNAAIKNRFPFLDLKAQFKMIAPEVMSAVEEVFASQHFIMGPQVESLETELAQYIGCRYAVACASGSDALLLALMALDVDKGDEVITTPFTFIATAGSIARLKAKPVFVDIEPDTFNIDVRQLSTAITPRTRAILPVHLFGLPANMRAIMEIAAAQRLPVIEDAAQSIAARYSGEAVGNIGSMGCFSFFPAKNLGGAGDGGLITTNDAALAAKLKVLRVHGSPTRYQYEMVGVNSRLDTLQAAILKVKLRYLDEWTAARQRNAERYRNLFNQAGLTRKIQLPVTPSHSVHVYNQFVIRSAQRDGLRKYLQEQAIPTEIYYPSPLHLQNAFAFLGHKAGDFPQSEQACREALALPICPMLTEAQQQQVVECVREFFVHN
jgi:dTDP-4-amino-4,6-dideoxygalactose transaminase